MRLLEESGNFKGISMKRRDFLKSSLVASSLTAISSIVNAVGSTTPQHERGEIPLIVSTWPLGKNANEAALSVLLKKGTILDAVEQGLWVTESDVSNASVGLAGRPNAA